MCFPEMSFVFLSAILWLLRVFCFKMLNISAGSRHWSNRRSRTQDAADADILWARSRFEPRCSQIQWTVGRTRQLLGVCSWWKRWSQWSPHLLWELSHVQKPGWSAWYTLPYSKEKGNVHFYVKAWLQCTFFPFLWGQWEGGSNKRKRYFSVHLQVIFL